MRVLTIGFILLFGISVLWIASSTWGIGYDPDSIIYEDVAENWLGGYGIARTNFSSGERFPMSNFPPLYPIVLGVLSQVIGSIAQSARILNTVIWGMVWFLVYRWIMRDGQSHHIAWSVATLLMINLLVFQVFGTSWSEPLFMALGLSGLWFIVSYQKSQHRKYLVLSSILFACAILTRYAGVALVMTAIIILFASDNSRRKRIQDILLLGILSGAPLLLWIGRNLIVRGDVAARDVRFTMIGLPQLQSSVGTLGSWLIPIPELSIALIIIGIMVTLLGWTFLQTCQQNTSHDIGIAVMRWWVIIYLLFIIASFMIIDPRIPFNYRILFPSYIGLMIVVGRWLAIHWKTLTRSLHLLWIVTGLALMFINGLLALNWVMIIGNNGQQYSDARFQQSHILQELRDTDLTDVTLYTNNNFLLYYQTDKTGWDLPVPDSTDFDTWLDNLPDDKPIQIIFFSLLAQRDWESTEQIESLLPVIAIHESEVVTVYELDVSDE